MMLASVTITLAGFVRTVPASLLKHYESFGWKVQGANPEAQSKTVKTTKRKSNEDRISK
jgi:hypothetical protein